MRAETMHRMVTEVNFLDPDDVNTGIAVLTALGFDVEVLPERIDPCGPTVWVKATLATELDEIDFLEWASDLTERFGGHIDFACLADDDEPSVAGNC